MKKPVKVLTVAAFCFTLIACKSVEERVEEKYQSAVALASEGDVSRAIVELRNIFELDGQHREARWMLSELLLNEQNNRRGAYSQLLRLAEQYPDDLEVRLLLSQLAFEFRNFDEFDRHGQAAVGLAPDDERVIAIKLGLDYRGATLELDQVKLDQLASTAEVLLGNAENDNILRAILIDYHVRNGEMADALAQVDALIEADSGNRRLHDQKLSILAELADADGVEKQLSQMIELFSDDDEIKSTLLRFYLSNNRPDDAESFLRNISSPTDEDPSKFVDLIRFVAQTKGQDAAIVEIERAIAESPDPTPFQALRASFWFADGREAEAIAEMETAIENANDDEILNGIRITLAQMFVSQNNEVGARRLIEEVIESDSINVDALKIRAAWSIESDEIEQAIADLRLALDAAPDDSEAMTLMSRAYTRQGSHELSRDFLALAVEASNNAPAETLRYAAALMDEQQFLPAEDTLIASLRLNNGNQQLLEMLGQLYLAMEDEARIQQVIDTLRNNGNANALESANALQAELLSQRDGADEALAFLEQLANSEDSSLNSQLFLLRGRLSTGDFQGARNLLDSLLQENPDSIELRSVRATVDGVAGDFEAAEVGFRALLAEEPTLARNWLELSRILSTQGKTDEAETAIEDGLEASPNDATLLWAKASILEQRKDIDGAIAIYERLYEASSGAPVIANNLASLLATYRDDEESLERAFVIARRLQGTKVPQFQDTIGWILHRRGEHQEALTYLEQSASALTDDPIAQYHLGMVQSALGQTDKALEQLQAAIDLAGSGDSRAQFLAARDEIIKLQNQ